MNQYSLCCGFVLRNLNESSISPSSGSLDSVVVSAGDMSVRGGAANRSHWVPTDFVPGVVIGSIHWIQSIVAISIL